jgi:hypothetical protein
MLPAGLNKQNEEQEMENAVTTLAGEEQTAAGFPATAALVESRDRYLQANEEASVLEAKLARLELDESEVLNDIGADEETQCKRLAEVRIRKDVQARRTSHKRLEVSRVLGEFEGAYPAAEAELSSAVAFELSRRRDILAGRVLAAIGCTEDKPELTPLVNRLIGTSPTIVELQACSPNGNSVSVSIEQRANDLIEQAEKLQAELARQI